MSGGGVTTTSLDIINLLLHFSLMFLTLALCMNSFAPFIHPPSRLRILDALNDDLGYDINVVKTSLCEVLGYIYSLSPLN